MFPHIDPDKVENYEDLPEADKRYVDYLRKCEDISRDFQESMADLTHELTKHYKRLVAEGKLHPRDRRWLPLIDEDVAKEAIGLERVNDG